MSYSTHIATSVALTHSVACSPPGLRAVPIHVRPTYTGLGISPAVRFCFGSLSIFPSIEQLKASCPTLTTGSSKTGA
ncbi:hypothetical protein PR001_g13105 [Phytophthora rubi]|uniref:Uncharacterized protein n=1 Tax=Phytophthora rubi TaxID=129364 RepID=A0A6A3LSP4_9STRA|nr:hypothetical protein PR001_g13105 [Phytophthora rubi]